METVFKEGDKVYCVLYGHGVVKKIDDESQYAVTVDFGNQTEDYTVDGSVYADSNPTLSFTEYTLKGFSQQRQIELPEVGELCLFRDGNNNSWVVRKFLSYDSSSDFPFITKTDSWKQMKRIKILD